MLNYSQANILEFVPMHLLISLSDTSTDRELNDVENASTEN